MDLLLGALVLVLTAFLALFPVRNSDIWLHLATGRALANGQTAFAAPLFSYNTANAQWINHSWLFDVFLYGLYQNLGGPVLIVLKALLLMGLAVLMMGMRGAREDWDGPSCARPWPCCR